jgi:hypothetical protein
MDERAGSTSHLRHYTVEQANAALPWVSERLVRIRDALGELLSPESTQALELVDTNNGGGYPGRVVAGATLALLSAASELQAVDVVLRDPQSGLIDFPSIRDGEEIYLCWRPGEDRVAWWHDPEAGFAGRRPL